MNTNQRKNKIRVGINKQSFHFTNQLIIQNLI